MKTLNFTKKAKSFAKRNWREKWLTEYHDLARLVLAAPKEWADFCRTVDLNGGTKAQPKKVSPPFGTAGYARS